MSSCSILRIGPTDPTGAKNGNAAALQSAITSHFRYRASSSSSPSSSDNDGNHSNDQLLAVSNRYFDAQILLLGLDESTGGEVDSTSRQEDGILLIFDASLPSSFDSLGRHHSSAELSDRCGELLRLCIGAGHGPSPLSDGSRRSEEEYSRRVLWCLDRGYEYVEVDLTPEGIARGHDKRDKDGFARVAEAITTCMWSSRVMKRREAARGGAARPGSLIVSASRKNDATKKDDEESQSTSLHLNVTLEKEKESISSTISDAEREKAALSSLMKGINDDGRPEKGYEGGDQGTRQREEMAFHQLESVLSEAKVIREASRNDSMSDKERRERAGKTATRLMCLLDRLGIDDGDDTDESNSDKDEQ